MFAGIFLNLPDELTVRFCVRILHFCRNYFAMKLFAASQRILVLPVLVLLLGFQSCTPSSSTEHSLVAGDTVPEVPPRIEYGFLLDTFHVVQGAVEPGMTLSHLLAPYGISQQRINVAAQVAKDSAGLNYISQGNKYTLLRARDTSCTYYCIYEKNKLEYLIFNFCDSVHIERVERPIEIVEKEISGSIAKNSNLVRTLKSSLGTEAVSGELAENIASIFAWTIDFFKLYPEDEFKIVYEEKRVEGQPYGIGNIKAVYFRNISQEYYAFRFEQDGETGYFDENGKGMKRPFLKAPLKFSRISSGYSLKRFHPVQKVWKAHLGTDYAAPTGTPIMAVGDGTIEQAGFAQYNGNYVKIKHNSIYQTAYLHMSKIEPGIRPGVKVKQGDIIGYVGATGLATGPHVCYRFWKNGQQVDQRQEKFQATEPIKKENEEVYAQLKDKLKARLDAIEIDRGEEEKQTAAL